LKFYSYRAGLASSAAGLACFVAALAKLYNVREAYPGQLSGIARQGSGSASRSMFGGFVKWQKGERLDGLDSIAIQVANEEVMLYTIYFICFYD